MMLMLAAALLASAPATSTATVAPASGAQAASAKLRAAGFSEAGIRTLQTLPPGMAQNVALLRQRGQAVEAELVAALRARPVDPARIDRGMRARDAFEADLATRRTANLTRIMTALSPADRLLFARDLVGTTPPRR